jgi:nucleoside-diphosphate-sugar epimerase
MRIVVTGAGGSIGRAFVQQALAAGHAVCALIRPGRSAGAFPTHPALTIGVGTLAAPPWNDVVRFGPEVCVHAAWITDPAVYLESAENQRYMEEGIALATGLFERGVGHIVAVGTCAEYRPSDEPLDEVRSPLKPGTPYARAKHELHRALCEQAGVAGARVAWARVFQSYGAGEPPTRLCSTLARRLAAGERVTLHTPQAVRDWIYVDDVATALLCLVAQRSDMVVNVGTGIGHTVETVALTLAEMLGQRELVVAAVGKADAYGPLVADPSRLRSLGWKPRVDLEAGLVRLIDGLPRRRRGGSAGQGRTFGDDGGSPRSNSG